MKLYLQSLNMKEVWELTRESHKLNWTWKFEAVSETLEKCIFKKISAYKFVLAQDSENHLRFKVQLSSILLELL